MTELKEARASEQSLVLFDLMAGMSILLSPILFEAVTPTSATANSRALVGLAVIAALLAGVLVWSRLRRCEEMDEFVRRMFERACGVAFGVTLATHLLWSTAERALLIRPMSAQDVAAVLIIATGLAWAWQRVREGRT